MFKFLENKRAFKHLTQVQSPKCYSALEVLPCGKGLSVYSEPDGDLTIKITLSTMIFCLATPLKWGYHNLNYSKRLEP